MSWQGLHKDVTRYFQQILEAVLYKIAVVWLLTSHLTNNPFKTIWDIAAEVRTNLPLFHKLLYMDTPVLSDHQKLTSISSVWTLDAVWRTYQAQWPIGMDGEESRESMLFAYLDIDNDENSCKPGLFSLFIFWWKISTYKKYF